MAGLVPAISVGKGAASRTGMAATRAAMTNETVVGSAKTQHVPASAALLTLVILAAAMAILAAYPQLDFELARRFYLFEDPSFGARFHRGLRLGRDLGYYLPMTVLAIAVLAWLSGKLGMRLRLAPSGRAV